MRRGVLALIILCAASTAESKCVVFDGDSITGPNVSMYGGGGEWPKRLQAMRPDVVPCNIARGGKNTLQALAGLDATIDWIQTVHIVTDAVLLIGINNTLIARPPDLTAEDILAWADKCVAQGITPHVLTLTPALNYPWANAYARDVSNWVQMLNVNGHDIRDLRDEFTWQHWGDCSADGIHPTSATCRYTIASFVARWLPAQ